LSLGVTVRVSGPGLEVGGGGHRVNVVLDFPVLLYKYTYRFHVYKIRLSYPNPLTLF
jgi:hypothetical protein